MASEHAVYASRHLIRKTAEVNDPALWQRLYAAIETQGFLAHQAEALGGFEQTTQDVEQTLLRHILYREDWERFLRYAQVAAHLRGLAEALGEEEVVQELGRAGRSELAESLVSQLSDPVRRVRLRALIAGALPRAGEVFGRHLEGVKQELKEASGEEPEAWCLALEGVARHLGPDLRARWPEWADSLPERALRDRVWRAVAESFLDRGDLEAPTLWRALASIEEPEALLTFLPMRVAALAPEDPWPLVDRLTAELGPAGPSVVWRLRLSVASTAEGTGAETLRRVALGAGPPPWTVDLVEAGKVLWPRLTAGEIEELCRSIGDPVAAVALRVVALEGAGETSGPAARTALAAVEAMPAGPGQLHWALRLLKARSRAPRSELSGPLAAVARHLARLRYGAQPGDLRLFLDRVAAVFPKDLRRQVENVLWAPESDAETLRALVRQATHPKLLEELFERAEEYAALVAETSAEGFELRCEILVTLCRRLCVSTGDLGSFKSARERLLPEEEDGLRREVAQGLAEVGRRKMAEQVADGIASGRSRLRSLLEMLPPEEEPERQALLTPQALYRAVADSAAVCDEIGALAALSEEPREPDDIARVHLDPLHSPGRRIEGLVDLAHHALTWQEEHFPRSLQDRLAAVLPLKQALGVVESDLWLVRLTPELVDVGARLGPKQAVAEVQEAWERVIGLRAVAWDAREEVLVALLARLRRFFPAGGGVKRLRGLLEWLARSPAAMDAGPSREELRRRWHRIFPWLAAVEAGLPDASRKSWAVQGLAKWRRRWDWLTPEQERMLAPSFASPEKRLRPGREEGWAWGLAARSTADAPEAVPGLVAGLGSSGERDRLGLLLLAGGWLPPEVGEELLPLLSEEGHARTWGEVWLELSRWAAGDGSAEQRFVHALARLAAAAAIAPSDPRIAPLRRRLWEVAQPQSLGELAGSVPAALASGGKQGGESALRLFLNAHLAPRWGRGASQGAAAWQRAKKASSLAERLDRQEAELEPDRDDPGSVPPPARLDSVERRWSQAAQRGPRASPWTGSVREILASPMMLFLIASALFLIPLDAPFWLDPSPNPAPGIATDRELGLSTESLFLVLYLAQAVLADRFLAWRFVAETRVWFGIRWLRFLLAGLPFFGLAMIPAWQVLMEAAPKWVLAPREPRLQDRIRLASRAASGHRLGSLASRVPVERWLAFPWTLAVLFLISFFWVLYLALPLGVVLTSPGGLDSLLLLSTGLHGLAFAGAVVFLALRSPSLRLSEPQRAVYLSLSVFWLIPVPAMTLFGVALWLFFEARVERQPLVAAAWPGGAGRLPVWGRLTARLRSGWQRLPLKRRIRGRSEKLDPRQGSGQVDRQVLWFYRGKAFALFLEAAALSWGIQRLAERSASALSQELAASLGILAGPSLILGTIGLMGMGVMLIRRLLRLSVRFVGVDGRQLAGFLAGTQLAFFTGLELGEGLFRGDAQTVSGVLLLVGLSGSVIYAGPLFLSMIVSLPEEREGVWWALFFAAVGLAGGGLARPENAPLLQFLKRVVLLGPGLAVIGAASRLDWFLRPAHPRQVFSSKTPTPLRRRLAFLLLSALAPGGGLLIPLWIWLRPRWWPELDPLAATRERPAVL